MKNSLSLLSIYLVTAALYAQPTIQWQKTFGGSSYDEAKSIQQTADGGYITAGSTLSNDGDIFGHRGGDDFWVLKLNNSGAIQWKKVLGGTDNEGARAIRQTTDGGYIVVGYTASNNFDVSGNHGGSFDAWVVKLNSNGAMQWQKALGGSGWDELWSVQQTADQGYILAGMSSSTDGDATGNHGQLDFWVVKLDEIGSIEWGKSLGGSKDDYGKSVKQTSDGGYIVVGETASNDGDVTGLHGNVDFWVVKLSAEGDIEWEKALGGSAGDVARDVIQSVDSGYIVVGYVGSHNSGDVTGHNELALFDYWVAKLSSEGALEWQKTVGGTNRDWGESIVPAGDGGYLVAGTSDSVNGDVTGNHGSVDFWVVKISVTGELLWQKSYGGSMADDGFSIANTSDNGFVLAGYSWSNDGDATGSLNRGKADFWIVKLSPESVGSIEPTGILTMPLEIFPNPAQQSISVQAPSEAGALRVTMIDLLGRDVFQQYITNGGKLDISALTPGLYTVAAASLDGQLFWGKIEKH